MHYVQISIELPKSKSNASKMNQTKRNWIQLAQIAIEPAKNKSNCATAHTKVETAHKSIELYWNKSQEGQQYWKCSFTSVSPEKEVHLNSCPVADFSLQHDCCEFVMSVTSQLSDYELREFFRSLHWHKWSSLHNIKEQSSTRLAPPVPQSGT